MRAISLRGSRTLSDPIMGGPQPIVTAAVAVSIPPGDALARFHFPAGNVEMEQ